MTSSAHERAVTGFRQVTGTSPDFVALAPGRVNLIGEHTDYNDGFVLPMGLPFVTAIAASASPDGVVSVESEGYGVASFVGGELPPDLPQWARYVAGANKLLGEEGHVLRGLTAHIATDIPTGASLSSSAALEVASVLAFAHASGFEISGRDAALLSQRVENEIMGYQTGIMDQFISATAEAGHASLIDCRTLTARPVPVPAAVIVIDTMSRRELVDSEYNLRRANCEAAAAAIGVDKLRDATIEQLDLIPDPTDRMRAEHIITENTRTEQAATAMSDGDAERTGELMNQSHASLRDLFDVSGPELNIAVDIAQSLPGCHGSRMTGGGFAGCCIALVDRAEVSPFVDAISADYARETGVTPRVWQCEPGPGAHVVT